MKRLVSFLLVILIWCSCSLLAFACDENQSDVRVTEILFGDNALRYSSDENVKTLLSALYLCCEQYEGDSRGQNKIDYLNSKKIKKIPLISEISIKENELVPCAHIAWSDSYQANNKIRDRRKKVLQNTVEHVFDFGWTWNYLLGGVSEKSKNFTALLYYFHILADYLADDPENTDARVKGKEIPPYCGSPYYTLNGNMPQFTDEFKSNTKEFIMPSGLDSLQRCGMIYATLGKEGMEFVGPRPDDLRLPNPSGWNQEAYPDIVKATQVYNRCHLIAREFCGIDNQSNLITGTKYLNDTMQNEFEKKIEKSLINGTHVAYRVTPIYEGNNLIPSGVQMEAYSVEDSGKLHFNVYCYNVQPGVSINYASGKTELIDTISNAEKGLPFAVSEPSDDNPDLIFEIEKCLESIFEDQKNSANYTFLMGDIYTIGYEARFIGIDGKTTNATEYENLKKCEYNLYNSLVSYVPKLLSNEEFFKSQFK